jgi:hypothetical protein
MDAVASALGRLTTMPRRHAALSLVALAVLGGATGCEKQSPFITITAHGVVVKARATKYCRDNGKCNASSDNPHIFITAGDTLGIDVPRSVAEQGWRIGDQGEFSHDHYRSIAITNQLPVGQPQELRIVRNPEHGEGEWRFTVEVR